MKHLKVIGLISAFVLAQGLRADVTMRHTMTFKLGSSLPPAAAEAMKSQLGSMMPNGILVQLKGDRVATTMGPIGAITDYANGTITMFNPKTKRYATIPIADYATQVAASQKIPAMPPEAQKMFDAMKIDVTTENTGQKATIHGIGTEEKLLVVSIGMPGMPGPGPGMKVEIHVWVASAEELKKIPALKELADYAMRAKGDMDPLAIMTKAFGNMPGMGEKMRAPMEAIMKAAGSTVIQMREALVMPMLSATEPSMEVVMDLVELSTASIPDTVFETPVGYEKAPMSELLAELVPKPAVK